MLVVTSPMLWAPLPTPLRRMLYSLRSVSPFLSPFPLYKYLFPSFPVFFSDFSTCLPMFCLSIYIQSYFFSIISFAQFSFSFSLFLSSFLSPFSLYEYRFFSFPVFFLISHFVHLCFVSLSIWKVIFSLSYLLLSFPFSIYL